MNGQLRVTVVLPPYLLGRRLDGPHSRPERCGEEENLLPAPRIEPRLIGRPFYSPDSILQLGNFSSLLPSSCVSVPVFNVSNIEFHSKFVSTL